MKRVSRVLLLILFLIPSLVTTSRTPNVSGAAAHGLSSATRIDLFTDTLSDEFVPEMWNATAEVVDGAWRIELTGGWGNVHARQKDFDPIANVKEIGFRTRAVDQRAAGKIIDFNFESDQYSSGFSPVTLTEGWQDYTFDHDGTPLTNLIWSDHAGEGLGPIDVDDVYMIVDDSLPPVPTPSGSTEVTLTVDPSQQGPAINPHVYGISFADAGLAAELDLSINRWGGNSTTRYNWKESVSNKASDWFFLNVPDAANDGVDPTDLPNTATFNQFIQQNLSTGTEALLTIPMIGWTPSGRNDNCGFRISQYGQQDQSEPFRPDCGNGENGGQLLYGSSPEDTSIAIDEEYTKEWLTYIQDRYGDEAVQYVALDNEPMLWNFTHRDVHPEPVSYDEIRDLAYQYAPAIKQVNPKAQTLGPVVWGWTAYEYSAADSVGGGAWWLNPPDRNAHSGKPFLTWYLSEMADYEAENDQRILDYLDIHFYPQQQSVSLTTDVSPATQALRLRSTRALWDPDYVDESWINESVQLIPRMKQLIAGEYPGTKLALTEYEWGAQGHINGALAQADVLGIFGREGIDMALFWANPQPSAPVSYAFRMYRNFDGQGGKFGSQSVNAASSDQDKVSIYAATSADGTLTMVIVNKSLDDIEVALDVAGKNGAAQVYQYSETALSEIVRLDERGVNTPFIMPKNSIQTIVFDDDATPAPTVVPTEPSPTSVPPTSAPPTATPVPPTPATATMVPTPSPTPSATPTVDPTPQSGVITGQVFADENGNGTYDSGEQTLAGITAILIDVGTQGQTTTITATTNSKGIYRIVNVPSANYILSFAIPPEYIPQQSIELDLNFSGSSVDGPSVALQRKPTDEETDSILLPLIMK